MTKFFDPSMRRDRAQSLLLESDQLCSTDMIRAAVDRLAVDISKQLAETYPIICCVMTGGIVLSGHLLTRLYFPLDVDYIDVSRYGEADRGGELTWHVRPRFDVSGRVILLVDDVLDEGRTLAQVKASFLEAGAAKVYTAVLVEKELDQQKPIQADFVGMTLPNRFIFGYGMDAYGYWRNLPSIHAIGEKEEN